VAGTLAVVEVGPHLADLVEVVAPAEGALPEQSGLVLHGIRLLELLGRRLFARDPEDARQHQLARVKGARRLVDERVEELLGVQRLVRRASVLVALGELGADVVQRFVLVAVAWFFERGKNSNRMI